MTSSRVATATAAVLLVLGGLAGIGWAALPGAALPQAASAALLAAGATAMALTGTRIAASRRLRAPLAAVATAVAVDRVLATAGDHAAWAGAATCALVLLWAVAALGPGAAMRLSPALTVAHGAAVAAAGESILFVGASPAAGLVLGLLAWPVHALRAARADRRRALRGVDLLVVGSADLREADVLDVGERVCRLAADLTEAAGAVLYVEGPGRSVVAGSHGTHPRPRVSELGGDPRVEAVLRGGPPRHGDPLLVPVTGEAGVVGVVAVHGARRAVDEVLTGLLALFGVEAGNALDRLRRTTGTGLGAVETDPVTGVGTRQQASSVVAGLRPGDGLVLLEVDGLPHVRAAQGEQAADLLLGQMGLHLRNCTRPGDAIARFGDDRFVIVLRDLKAPVDVVVRRIAESWLRERPGRRINIGAALHLEGAAPLDTLERTQAALPGPRPTVAA